MGKRALFLAAALLVLAFGGVASATSTSYFPPIYLDYAADRDLDFTYSPWSMRSYLNNAEVDQYGDPAVVLRTRRAGHEVAGRSARGNGDHRDDGARLPVGIRGTQATRINTQQVPEHQHRRRRRLCRRRRRRRPIAKSSRSPAPRWLSWSWPRSPSPALAWGCADSRVDATRVPAWRVFLWMKLTEAVLQLRPRAVLRLLTHPNPRTRVALRWCYRVGRRAWFYEIRSFGTRCRTRPTNVTLADFWKSGAG